MTTHCPKEAAEEAAAASFSGANAEAIHAMVLVLETCPYAAVIPHIKRLECLARNAHEASSFYHGERRSSAPNNSICQSALSNDFLLGKILKFDASLAFYHKRYGVIVGYESPMPHDWSIDESHQSFQ